MLSQGGVGDILPIINSGGIVGVLALIIVMGVQKKWVFGWIYSDKLKECEAVKAESNEWKEMALRGVHAAETGTETLKQFTDLNADRFKEMERFIEQAKKQGFLK